MTPRPPRVATALIGWVARELDRDSVLADLREEFEAMLEEGDSVSDARRWYHRQVAGSLIPLLRCRFGRRGGARRRLGSSSGGLLVDFAADVRLALRVLVREKGFAAVSIVILTLGIGSSAAVFAVVEAVLLRPLPYADADRLVQLREAAATRRGSTMISPEHIEWDGPSVALQPVDPMNLRDWQERNRVFSGVAGVRRTDVNVTGGLEPVRVGAHLVYGDLFGVLGADARLGRTLVPEDAAPGAESVVVLGHGLWQRVFRTDVAVIGRTVRLDDEPHTVVGVMPEGFTVVERDGGGASLWTPAPLPSGARRVGPGVEVVARLRPGVAPAQAQADMDVIAAALASEYPEANRNRQTGEDHGARVTPIREYLVSPVRSSLLILASAVAVVLLIAWVNVTNLLLTRGVSRRREIAVRTAIGAGRWRVGRQLLTETLVLSSIGGLFALALARPLVAWVIEAAPAPDGGTMGLSSGALPLLPEAEISLWVVAMTGLTCLVTSVVCGVWPVVRAAKTDVNVDLKSSGRRPAGRGRGVELLAAAEVALSMVLLIGIGLLVGTMRNIAEVPVGFETEDRYLMRTTLTRDRYAEPTGESTAAARWSVGPRRATMISDVVARLESAPDVVAAGAAHVIPIQDAFRTNFGMGFHIEGEERETRFGARDGVTVHGIFFATWVTAGYFDAMGIPLIRGRSFTGTEDRSAPGVVVVSEEFMEWFDVDEPVGRRLLLRDGGRWRSVEIVGVARGVLHFGYYRDALSGDLRGFPFVYIPHTQTVGAYPDYEIDHLMTANFVVRHRGDPRGVGEVMREALRAADPELPVVFTEPAEAYLAENLAERRFQMVLVGLLAVVALVMALVGIYGVMAFRVGQRLHEIGVRLVLGAHTSGVVRMIVGDGARVAVLGVLLGIAGAMGATRLLSPWLYGVSPTEPAVFLVLGVLMVAAALLACWLPARRAAVVDPVESLRTE